MTTIESTSLLSKLKASKRLPSPPGTALRVLELCRRDDVEVQEVADAIMSDAALSGRLLKFANSPISGLGRPVTSIREAIMLLGLRTVKLTSLGFSLSATDNRPLCEGFNLNRFWAESFAAGVIARHLAQKIFATDREEAFTAALMASIGRLALAQGMASEYSKALAMVQQGTELWEAERVILGLDHVEFGVQLLSDWGLPDVLIAAVARQKDGDDSSGKNDGLARTVRAAVRLAPLFASGKDIAPAQVDAAREVVRNSLKLDESEWKQVSEQVLGEYLQIAELFEVKLGDESAVMDLYAEAQEEASRVGLVAQIERTEALKANADLLQRASTDALTGIANRAKFNEKLAEMIKGLHRGHSSFALLMLDIDHFKKLNDTHGHPGGDLVLKRVGRAVQNCLRDVDLLARYGGEEFAIVAPQADRRGACIVAARVRKCVEDLRIDHNGEILNVTISIGVAVTADYAAPPSGEQLVADADAQLYLSKKAGRNTWSYRGRSATSVA